MKLQVIILAPLILLSACSDRIEQAKQSIEAVLPTKQSVEYRNIQTFGNNVVCGEHSYVDFNWQNTPFRRFIVWGEVVIDFATKDDWEIFCSDDPEAALYSTLGIAPLHEQRENLDRITGDIDAIRSALEAYLADNLNLPSTRQGLEALTIASDIPPQPRQFRAGGYLSPIPIDPWNRSYLYQRSSLAGVAQNYQLQTLGADGVPGGKGEDADISMSHLKYIKFVGR